jgi:outer membrane protein OmpA-like peptidoglycan-associated protein
MSPKLLPVLCLFITSAICAQTTIVHFDFNTADLTRDARRTLDKLVASKKLSGIGVFGHTDQMGNDDYNEWLSLQRARSVRDYLLSKGLTEDKVAVVLGYGAQRPVSLQMDSTSRQLNRRVVIMNNYKWSEYDKSLAARQATLQSDPTLAAGNKQAASNTATTDQKAASEPVVVKKDAPIVKQQKSEKLIEDIKDNSTKAGENIVLKNINFHVGSHEFLEAAYAPLQDLLETMQKIPTLEIEIQGHVCCQDGDTDALDNATGEMALSVNRAKGVYEYLIKKGIDKKRLSFQGLAHKYPLIAVEKTKEDEIANRRVEIKIIKK